jgi:hypothetical protein
MGFIGLDSVWETGDLELTAFGDPGGLSTCMPSGLLIGVRELLGSPSVFCWSRV